MATSTTTLPTLSPQPTTTTTTTPAPTPTAPTVVAGTTTPSTAASPPPQSTPTPAASITPPHQQSQADPVDMILPGLINDDDDFPISTPIPHEGTGRKDEELPEYVHSPAAAASPAVLSPIAASVPMGDQSSTSPAPAEDKYSRLYAIIQEQQQRDQEMVSEQKELIFEGERFYFFDLSNAFVLTQLGFHGAVVVQELHEATALIFTRKDKIQFNDYKHHRLFSIECLADSISMNKRLPGSIYGPTHYHSLFRLNFPATASPLRGPRCEYRRPLLSRCFEGIRVAADRSLMQAHGAELREMVEMMGGTFDGDTLRHETGFFVCESNTSQCYQVAAQRDLHVVKVAWVVDCFRELRFIRPAARSDRYVLKAFDSCVICAVRFEENTLSNMEQNIKYLGGEFTRSLNENCTHYITTDGLDTDIKRCQNMGIPVVRSDWLYDSINARSCLPTAQYVISEAVQPQYIGGAPVFSRDGLMRAGVLGNRQIYVAPKIFQNPNGIHQQQLQPLAAYAANSKRGMRLPGAQQQGTVGMPALGSNGSLASGGNPQNAIFKRGEQSQLIQPTLPASQQLKPQQHFQQQQQQQQQSISTLTQSSLTSLSKMPNISISSENKQNDINTTNTNTNNNANDCKYEGYDYEDEDDEDEDEDDEEGDGDDDEEDDDDECDCDDDDDDEDEDDDEEEGDDDGEDDEDECDDEECEDEDECDDEKDDDYDYGNDEDEDGDVKDELSCNEEPKNRDESRIGNIQLNNSRGAAAENQNQDPQQSQQPPSSDCIPNLLKRMGYHESIAGLPSPKKMKLEGGVEAKRTPINGDLIMCTEVETVTETAPTPAEMQEQQQQEETMERREDEDSTGNNSKIVPSVDDGNATTTTTTSTTPKRNNTD